MPQSSDENLRTELTCLVMTQKLESHDHTLINRGLIERIVKATKDIFYEMHNLNGNLTTAEIAYTQNGDIHEDSQRERKELEDRFRKYFGDDTNLNFPGIKNKTVCLSHLLLHLYNTLDTQNSV